MCSATNNWHQSLNNTICSIWGFALFALFCLQDFLSPLSPLLPGSLVRGLLVSFPEQKNWEVSCLVGRDCKCVCQDETALFVLVQLLEAGFFGCLNDFLTKMKLESLVLHLCIWSHSNIAVMHLFSVCMNDVQIQARKTKQNYGLILNLPLPRKILHYFLLELKNLQSLSLPLLSWLFKALSTLLAQQSACTQKISLEGWLQLLAVVIWKSLFMSSSFLLCAISREQKMWQFCDEKNEGLGIRVLKSVVLLLSLPCSVPSCNLFYHQGFITGAQGRSA